MTQVLVLHRLFTSHSRRFFCLLLGALLLPPAIGCGGDDMGYVSGTVTVNGKPVGPGVIKFYRVDSPSRYPPIPSGAVGEDGRYTLRLSGSQEGAPPGAYEVTIVDKDTDLGFNPNNEPPKSGIPFKYRDRKQSDLTATVEPGHQTIDFDLEP